MACKDVKNVVEEYGTVMELVKAICTDRACTLDAIQKSLAEKDVIITETALLAVIAQIKEMITFRKESTYDIGDAVTYKTYWILGMITRDERIGNMIRKIEYKNFYLYNDKRFWDSAFIEHINSKLEFEKLGITDVNSAKELYNSLVNLNIKKEGWTNYVFLLEEDVHCKKWNKTLNNITTEYLGKLIRRT